MKYQAASKRININTEYTVRIEDPKCKYFDVDLSVVERQRFFKRIFGDKLRYT